MRSTTGSRINLAAVLLICGSALLPRPASAEVTLLKNDEWEVYATGRVNAFLSYAWGDSEPISGAPNSIPTGGGFEVKGVADSGPLNPDMTATQGKFASMRIRSGFVPNVFAMGLRRTINENTKAEIFVSIWGSIETANQRKTDPTFINFQEGWGRVTGPWGSVLAGRALDLFSRGATENDFLYGHGYALGFPGSIVQPGPAAGMIGFGVIAAFFSPGLVYATPNLAGFQLTAGVYEPTVLAGNFEYTRTLRPEGELTYDFNAGSFKTHLFVNGLYQKVYHGGSTEGSQAAAGVGFGGRLELGPAHLGFAGHRGKGLGIHYALEGGTINIDAESILRAQDGYSIFGQYALGPVDLNLGWGISRLFLTDSDKTITGVSIFKQESAAFGAVVWHATPNVHASVDLLLGNAQWYLGEKQAFNFLNTGMTYTW